MKKYLHQLLALLLVGFALLTLFLSSSVIFDWFGIRAREGNYVHFVVWANFLCSLGYLAAAYGLFRRSGDPCCWPQPDCWPWPSQACNCT